MVNQANTTTALTSSANPSVFGQSVTFTATVSPVAPGAGTPDRHGHLQGRRDDDRAPAPSSGGVATFTTSTLSVGDPLDHRGLRRRRQLHRPAPPSALSQVVNKANTTTGLTSDTPDPSVADESYQVTWTVTVNSPGAGTPTGNVTVSDGDGNTCSAPVATGFCNLTSGTAGTKTLSATYPGNSSFVGSSGTASHTVNTRQTTTGLVCVPATVVVSEATTCTATVTDTESAGTKSDPAGTVAIASDGSGSIVTSPCVLDGGLNTTDGISTCAIIYTPSAFGTGTHNLSADYTANDDVHAASSDADGFDLTVHLRATSTVVVCVPGTVVVAEDTTCTVTVTDIGTAGTASDPSGTASLYSDSDGTFSPASTCTLVGGLNTTDGISTCAVTYDANTVDGGLHTITAGYAPDDDVHAGSNDTTGIVVTVNSRATTTSVSCDAAVVVGQAASCTIAVTDSDPAGTKSDPSGTVTASSSSTFGAFTGNPCALAGGLNTTDGISTCSVSYTPSAVDGGSHTITAAYSPTDDIHTGSSDTTGDSITVNKADTTTTITSDLPDPTVVNEDYTVSWTVTVDLPGAGSPTGNVTVSDGAGGSLHRRHQRRRVHPPLDREGRQDPDRDVRR